MVVAGATAAGVDPSSAVRTLTGEADAASKNVDVHGPHEFIDTLAPDSPAASRNRATQQGRTRRTGCGPSLMRVVSP